MSNPTSILTPWFGDMSATQKTAADLSTAVPLPTTVPGGIQAGDRIYIVGFSGAAATNVFSTPTTGSLWSAVVAQFSGTGNTAAPSMALFTRKATGGESGNITCPHTNVITTMGSVVVRGVDATTALDISAVVIDKTVTNNQIEVLPTAQSPKTLLNNGVLGLSFHTGNSTTITATPPSGWVEAKERTVASSRAFEVCYREDLDAGSIGPIVASPGWSGSSKGIGVTLFLRPATPRVDAGVTSGIYTKVGGVLTEMELRVPDGVGGFL